MKYDMSINDYVGEKEFAPFWLFDAKLSWDYKISSVYIEATNLFDEKYIDIANVNMPGRWFKAGISVQIAY